MACENWIFEQKRFGYDCWMRSDGVSVYRPSGRAKFRVHRPNAIGYGFEDLIGPKGTARTFQTSTAAKAAADCDWPLSSDTRTGKANTDE